VAKANNSRRIVYGALTTSMLMLATACGSSSGTPDDGKTHLTMNWHERDRTAMDAAIAGFESENSDVKIDITYLPSETITQVALTQFTAGTTPDLFFMSGGSGLPLATQRLADLGYLLPIDIPADKIPESIAAQVTLDGQGFGWPMFVLGSGGVSVNTTLAESLGISWPTTFPELLNTCRDLRDQGLVAIGYPAGSERGAQSVVASLVTSTGAADPQFYVDRLAGEATFASSDGWMDGLAKLDEMKDAGCFQDGFQGATPESVIGQFGENEVLAVVPAGIIPAPSLEAADPSIEIVDHPFPGTTEEETVVVVGTAAVLGINAELKGPQLEAAQKFLSYVMTPEVTEAFGEVMLGFGAYELADPDFKMPPAFAGSRATFEAGRTAPLVHTQFNRAEVHEAYGTCAQGLVTEQLSPSDCGKLMDEAWDLDK